MRKSQLMTLLAKMETSSSPFAEYVKPWAPELCKLLYLGPPKQDSEEWFKYFHDAIQKASIDTRALCAKYKVEVQPKENGVFVTIRNQNGEGFLAHGYDRTETEALLQAILGELR